MPDDYPTLVNPLMRGVGNIADRPISSATDIQAPTDIEIVSADNHWAITEDIFYQNFPARLRDRAPRVWHDEYWRIGHPGVNQTYGFGKNIQKAVRRANLHTAWSHDVRKTHLKVEGIAKEIVFPQLLLGYFDPDPEIREWIYRVYNDYIADQSLRNPGFIGMGVFSNWWDQDKVQASMDQIVKLGLKGFLLPLSLRGGDNRELSCADSEMRRFWAVAEEARIPICFHVGESLNYEGPGALATGFLISTAPFRRPISQLVFGGVFDQHPNLEVVFAEGGIGWVLPWLQDAEALYDTWDSIIDPVDHRPSDYWRKNCYATFQADALGLSRLDILGADRVMWAADYPHTEGTFGFSRKMMQAIIDQVGQKDAMLVLGGNAKRVFDI